MCVTGLPFSPFGAGGGQTAIARRVVVTLTIHYLEATKMLQLQHDRDSS